MSQNIYEKLVNKETKLAVIGLGYVGLPIALEFAKQIDVIGFDINEKRIGGSYLHPQRVSKLSKLVGSEDNVYVKSLLCALRNSCLLNFYGKDITPAEVEEIHPYLG